MRRKGFTLIELLAVILVLAIIAIITVPTIIGVIERARKGAAESSALGYIDAIEKQIALDSVEGIIHQDKDDYVYDEIEVSVKGSIPTGGIYTLNSNKVTTGTFCINNYIVEYSENKAKASTKCKGEDLKLSGSVKLSKNSTNISYPNIDTFEVIENTSGGNLTCETSDSNVATCSIKDKVVTVKSEKKEGNATLTIKSEGNSKYKEATAAFVVVTANGLMSVTANGYTGVYDGKAHGISVEASGATIKYGTTSGTYDLSASPTRTDVGTTTVYYQVTKEGYKTVTGSKDIVIMPLLNQAVAVGNYIKMTPTSTSYTILSSKTGYDSDQTINPSELNLWRVIKINSDGTIEVVSENVSSTLVYFKGQTGYKNLVGVLNLIASQYTNTKYVKSTRHMGYNGQTEYLTDTSSTVDSTSTTAPWTCSAGGSCNPTESKGGGDTLFINDENLVTNALGTSVANNPSGTASNYFLASRVYYYYSSSSWRYYVRVVVYSGSISYYNLYRYESGFYADSVGVAVRPILTLKSGLPATGSGTSSDPYVLE